MMPKKIQLVDYLSREQLKEKYLKSSDRIESRRWHLLWKISVGWTIKDSALAVGLNYEYARRIVQKYNQQGEESISNKKKTVARAGRPPLLNQEQLEHLATALQSRPSDGGVWTGPKVARWLETQTGRKSVGNQRGWDYLKKSHYSWKFPRARHKKADPAEQKEFQQKLPAKILSLNSFILLAVGHIGI